MRWSRPDRQNGPPRWAQRLLKRHVHSSDEMDIAGTLLELYRHRVAEAGGRKSDGWYVRQVLGSVLSCHAMEMKWSLRMIANYLKMAVRTIQRSRAYSLINIAGLALGIACCLLITLYVAEEMSFDNYHGDNVFRVGLNFKSSTGTTHWAAIGPGVGPTLKRDFPQVESATRLFDLNRSVVKHDDQLILQQDVYYVDDDLFDVFKIGFIHGRAEGALARPHTAVMSREMAEKYFGVSNPVGRELTINDVEYEVTGVVEDAPSNTHFHYEILLSMESFEAARANMPGWGWTVFQTYIKLAPGVDPGSAEVLIRDMESRYVTPEEIENRNFSCTYFLQPIHRIHLHSDLWDELGKPGNPLYVMMTGAVGLVILLIACINFMNLTTARFSKRAIEIGLRKVMGARRKQLVIQFLGESFLMTWVALMLALAVSAAVLPLFNSLAEKTFDTGDLFHWKSLAASLILLTGVGLLAGAYPAVYLSRYNPGAVIGRGRGNTRLRRLLVVGQFTVSIILLAGTFVVYSQLKFMKSKNLGFDKERKVMVEWGRNDPLTESYETVKREFLQIAGVHGATVSSGIPGYGLYGWQLRKVGVADNKAQFFNYCLVDGDFLSEFALKIAVGRAFSKEMSTDVEGPLIINEAAVKALGWQSDEEALGAPLRGGPADGRVIGVLRDFHFKGVQDHIEPMVMVWAPRYYNYLTLSLDVGDPAPVVRKIQKKWEDMNPGGLFTCRFVDVLFDRYYQSTERTGRIFTVFTGMGLFISCLGLLGLVSYTVEKRNKEIGIRKVLGASVPGLFLLLSSEYMRWIGAAVLIACPAAFLLMNKWLENFAFRIHIGAGVFLMSIGIVFVVAIITVGVQTVRSAAANPVDAIRYE